MAFFKVSLTGDLGGGKTTVGDILKVKFGAEIVSVGKIQRTMAAEMGMDTCAFNKYQETHPEIDKELDDRLASYENKDGNYIFDSRLAWHFVPSSYSIYLKCDPYESARRIVANHRTDESYSSIEECMEMIKKRRESEKERYKKFYGVDITDMNNYDLVVDTTKTTAEEVAEIIAENWKKANENK